MIKQIGIYVDDTGPHVMEHVTGAVKTIALPQQIEGSNKDGGIFTKSEIFDYDIELERKTNYYAQLNSIVTPHDGFLLFGPSSLKIDLYNLFRLDSRFGKTHIEIKQTDAMTDSQQQCFMMEYFENLI